jgi:uncharacterized protein YodC (DUF2158 family)
MSNTFKIADVVQLLSGGANMTVYRLTPVGVGCVWYSEPTGKYEMLTFSPAILKLISRASAPARVPAHLPGPDTNDHDENDEEDGGEPAMSADGWASP